MLTRGCGEKQKREKSAEEDSSLSASSVVCLSRDQYESTFAVCLASAEPRIDTQVRTHRKLYSIYSIKCARGPCPVCQLESHIGLVPYKVRVE